MHYSPSHNSFYLPEIHGSAIPADTVEITREQHAALLEGQSQGKVIAADSKGHPVLQDPPNPTPEQLQEQAKAEARAYLASTDWYVVRQTETGEKIPAEVTKKRQAARDSIK